MRFYLLLLFKAGHGESKVYGVDLKKGQFLTGKNALNSELNEGHRANSKHFVSSSTMYSWLKWLKANNLIDMQTTSEYTVITVFEAIDDSEVNNQLNNSSTTVQHKQELKELRELKEFKKR